MGKVTSFRFFQAHGNGQFAAFFSFFPGIELAEMLIAEVLSGDLDLGTVCM
jgi:hypothetical protein